MEYEGPKHTQALKKLKKIAKLYKLSVRFVYSMSCSGEYHPNKKMARVLLDNPLRLVISSFFHELGHHIDYTSGLYKSFYLSSSSLTNMRRHALSAELHTDKVGEELCNHHFPKVKYDRSYRSKADQQWLRDYFTPYNKKAK